MSQGKVGNRGQMEVRKSRENIKGSKGARKQKEEEHLNNKIKILKMSEAKRQMYIGRINCEDEGGSLFGVLYCFSTEHISCQHFMITTIITRNIVQATKSV